LQKSGHGDLVQTQYGDWYVVFLVGRPLTKLGRCITGRETAIQKVTWNEGEWPVLAHGTNEPLEHVETPALPNFSFEKDQPRDDFDSSGLNINFQSLRIPMTEEWMSLEERPGYLRIRGRDSLSSFHHQSMIARRVQQQHIVASTCVEFYPDYFQQMAGLVCYYNTYHYHYLCITSNDDGSKKLLNILTCDKYVITEVLEEMIDITGVTNVFLKVDFNGADLQFYYGTKEGEWTRIGPVLDGSILSDDYVQDSEVRYRPAFTGAFVGMVCQDLTGGKKHADFDWFEYKEIDS